MVCQNEVLGLFKGLKSHKRLDLMVSLLHASLPYELRFFGTILEYLGKKDFHELRLAETEANNVVDLNSVDLTISSSKARLRLTLYLALVRSSNYPCSNIIFQLLVKEVNELTALYKNGDDSVLDDLLLIFSLATHHPAFSFKQHTQLKEIYDRLRAEEEARCAGGPIGHGLDRVPCVNQAYPSCVSNENHLVGVASSSPTIPPIPTPVDPAFNLHQDAVSGAPLRMPFTQHHSPILINPNWAIVTNSAILPGGTSDSPLQSRTSSPVSRPGSPSLPAGSNPTTPATTPSAPAVVPPSQLPPTITSVRGKFPPPRVPPPAHGAPNDIGFKETILKEMPKYSNSLQHFTSDQLSRMSDDELREINLPTNAVTQLRAILNNRSSLVTNGIGTVPSTDSHSGNEFKKKGDSSSIINECDNLRRFHITDATQLYPGAGPGTGPLATVCSHIDPNACMGCFSVAVNSNSAALSAACGGSPQQGNGGNGNRAKHHPPHHCLPLSVFAPGWCPTYAMQQPHHSMAPPHPSHLQFTSPAMPVEAMRSLRIVGLSGNHPDNDPSSASDTASDHSPPDTPAPVQVIPIAGVEPSVDERLNNSEDRRGILRSHGGQSRGLGRHRNGMQNIPRGRGHSNSHRRRDLNSNGNPDRGPNNGQSDRSGSGEAPPSAPQATPHPTAYFSYMTATPYVRQGTACYPPATAAYHPAPYVHQGPYPPPSYHNGACHVISTDLIYPYAPGPSGPPTGGGGAAPFLPPPPQPSYTTATSGPPPPQPTSQQLPPPPPPPPLCITPMLPKGLPSCYNCGSQVHVPEDCPEQTIDEITKQGQYRIDYTPSSTGAPTHFQPVKVSDHSSPTGEK